MIDFAQRPAYLQYASKTLGVTFDPKTAVTLTRLDQHGNILGVVIFSRFTIGNCEVTVSGTPGWLSRDLILASLAYVFGQMQLRRVTAFVAAGNERSLSLAQRLGFKREGIARQWFAGHDAIMLGMLREDCHWLKELHGLPQRPAGT